jgi:hypothetical protein
MKQQWRRRLAYGSNATFVSLMVVAMLVLVYVLADRNRVRIDLTEEGRNSLSADMLSKLSLLDLDEQSVQITAFSAQRGKDGTYFQNREIRDLLREIGDRSVVVEWRFVDFDKERLTAEHLGVTEYGHIVVQRGVDRVDIRNRELFRRVGRGKDRRQDFIGESALGRAFSQLHTPKRRVVYVLKGHGELDPEDRSAVGLSDLAEALDGERYDVDKLDLMGTDREGHTPTVPDDAAVVFLPRPTSALSPHETDALIAYLGRGGGLWIAADVGNPLPQIASRLGISLIDGVAMDKRVVFPFWDRPIPRIRSHPTTAGLRDNRLIPVLAHAAPLHVADPSPDGVKVSALLTTSRDGWAERGGALEGGAPRYDPDIDGAGPVTLAVAVQLIPGRGIVRAGRPPARVVVVGDVDAFTNQIIGDGPGNIAFALDVVHWLAGADRRVATGGMRRGKVRRLALTKQQTGTLQWVSLGILPTFFGLMGFLVAASRRGR